MPGLPFFLPALLPGGPDPYTITTAEGGGSAGSLHGIASICEDAKARIIAQYRDKPRIAAWLCSYLDRLQDADDTLVSIAQNALSLDLAEGDQLDLLGAIVREARDGRNDETYRRALRVRIRINRSQGRVEDLIGIASLFEDDQAVRLRQYQPARVVVFMQGLPVNEPAALHTRLRRAKAAGVALQTVTHPAAASVSGIFDLGSGAASVDKAETLTGLGWTGDARGGALAHVLG